MANKKVELGLLVRRMRESLDLTQEALADELGAITNRTAIGYLEQGSKLPRGDVLEAICIRLGVPRSYWAAFTEPDVVLRFDFEELLSELTGQEVSAEEHGRAARLVVERRITSLFTRNMSAEQTLDLLNSICVFYGLPLISRDFFDRYLGPPAFGSHRSLHQAIEGYQRDAIRLFATFREAFVVLNRVHDLGRLLARLKLRDLSVFHARADWESVEPIDEDRLADLGYMSAKRVQQEAAERRVLTDFLGQLADDLQQDGMAALDRVSARRQRQMDSLLRKFDSTIQHGIGSSLFSPDADELRREAERLAPKTEAELARMESTQQQALGNLATYLSADHLDVYVATSMRSDADFVSVNRFVVQVFEHELIRPLKLRYFNPTQSWIEDRIAKGLVEALMLRRSALTIYMAQKSDTFGKDSEASVALGQGKPVIVYVPKLAFPADSIDAENLIRRSRAQLIAEIERLSADPEEAHVDETMDDEALAGRLLRYQLDALGDDELTDIVRTLWADFDLYGESDRFRKRKQEAPYRAWLDEVVRDGSRALPSSLRDGIVRMLVAVAIRMESRARVFREIHPLALQVILSTGVLNGILVARTPDQCARVMKALLENDLSLSLEKDDLNYRVVENETRSTIRVISRNRLLQYAFDRFYSVEPSSGEGTRVVSTR